MEHTNILDPLNTQILFDGVAVKACQEFRLSGTKGYKMPQQLNCIKGSFSILLLEEGAGHYFKDHKEIQIICVSESHHRVRVLTLKDISIVGYNMSFSTDSLLLIEKYDFIATEFIPGSEIKEQ